MIKSLTGLTEEEYATYYFLIEKRKSMAETLDSDDEDAYDKLHEDRKVNGYLNP